MSSDRAALPAGVHRIGGGTPMRRDAPVPDDARATRVAELALAHLDAAHNLARWLTRDDHDARDVVQEAFVRALRYAASFEDDAESHDGGRGWWLAVVRNTARNWLNEQTRQGRGRVRGDAPAPGAPEPEAAPAPEAGIDAARAAARMHAAIAALSPDFREVLVLREMEERSYADIARIVGVPVGTVMSRLARARRDLREALAGRGDGRERRGL